MGPYIDFGGINVSIITLCAPAPGEQGVHVHVLGCDHTRANVKGVFLRALKLRDPAVILLGPNGRVVAANNSRIATGTLVHEDLRRAATSLDASSGNPTRVPWKLITFQPRSPS